MKRQDERNACAPGCRCGAPVNRRNFLKITGASSLALLASRMGVMAGPFAASDFEKLVPSDKKLSPEWVNSLYARGTPRVYQGKDLKYIGMPIGGLCTGQVYLGGDGRLWHWDIFNKHVQTVDSHYAHPMNPSAPLAQGFALQTTVLGKKETRTLDQAGCPEVNFRGEYPIGRVEYGGQPLAVSLEAFSPFIPLNVDDSSLPATVLRFTLKNASRQTVTATLFGWLENAVSLNNRHRAGTRRNRIVNAEGYSFLSCSAEKAAALAKPRPDICFEDWNKETYDGWTVEGTAFGAGPIKKSAIPAHQGDVGGDTERVVNSHATAPGQEAGAKDAAVGKLTSKRFTIERYYINAWVGGGAHEEATCVNVLVDGQVVGSLKGNNNNKMTLQSLAVQDFQGKEAVLEIVDAEKESWGNIGVGRITFSDRPAGGDVDLEQLPDYGTMGLALLGPAADYAVADAGPDGRGGTPGPEAAAPLKKKLVGALGRTLKLKGGKSAVVTFVVTWNFPHLTAPGKGRYYATKFANAEATAAHIARHIEPLYTQTKLWRDTWYDSTLPYWFLDRTLANASILATSTAFRFANGTFWGWEGVGCCAGTCTHVWHYEQTMGRLFPELDILLREKTDLNPAVALHPDGSIGYRGGEGFAVDGQAGIVLRCLRDHQVSTDDAFLKRNWPNIKKALGWLMVQDVDGDGLLDKCQHNTLDAEWYGQVAWLSGLYLAAVRAGEVMALELGDADFAQKCRAIVEVGRKSLVAKLWNGEYFIQVGDPKLAKSVGSYDGCEIDQVLGQGWAHQIGLGQVLPAEQTRTALKSLWKYNFTPDVGPFRKANPPGRWYAMAGEAGTLMCSWPRGDAKRVSTGYDFYFNECMNGFEHQLAGHMIWENMLLEGLAIERAVHDRYDGSRRNPWNEVECGDHYARSMASYGVFLAACGFEYHGPKGHLGFAPRLSPENFKAAFTAAAGWGAFSQQVKDGQARFLVEVKRGEVKVKTLAFALKEQPRQVKVSVDGRSRKSAWTYDQGRLLVTLDEAAVIPAGGQLQVRA